MTCPSERDKVVTIAFTKIRKFPAEGVKGNLTPFVTLKFRGRNYHGILAAFCVVLCGTSPGARRTCREKFILKKDMKILLALVILHLSSAPGLCWQRRRRQSDYWGEWGDWGECSRTCGSGITVRYRHCISQRADRGTNCVGPSKAFRSCNIQDCPEGSRDFREEQCSQFDGIDFQGKRYKWLPYYGADNKCELNCIPKGENFYYRHRQAVVDGTPCHPGRKDVCVEGVCKPVGCDNMLESPQKEDPCLVCGGNGQSCYLVRKTFSVLNLPKGYNQMFIIPVGATSIRIREVAPTRNFVAIKNVRGEYYLNGHWAIDYIRTSHIASTVLHYERGAEGDVAPETIRGRGPTTEPLVIELISQEQNQGVDYEYYLPSRSLNEGYFWSYGSWSECSKECGAGYQSRLVFCTTDNEAYPDYLCVERPRPQSNRTCNLQPCPQTQRMAYYYRPQVWMHQEHLISRVYSWKTGEWSACSTTCDGGVQRRSVSCLTHDGSSSHVVEEAQCASFSARPHSEQACNLRQCASWSYSTWTQCSVSCGEGQQTRSVVCLGASGARLQDFSCSSLPKEATVQRCKERSCPQLISWHIGDWGLCSKSCKSGLRERQVICSDPDHNFYNAEFCDSTTKPPTTEYCNTQDCSRPQWVPSMPDPQDYDNTHLGILVPYISEEPSTDYRDGWRDPGRDGSRTNDGGTINLYNQWESQPQRCTQSQYGCCSDGWTPASGPQGSGCPGNSCTQTRFGCCPDGVRDALDRFRAGCQYTHTPTESYSSTTRREPSDSCRSTTYGCCYDRITPAAGSSGEGCHSRPNHSLTQACTLPNANGPCSDWTARWYYDDSSGGCGRFWYGGCHGNRNNFATEEECRQECLELASHRWLLYGPRLFPGISPVAGQGTVGLPEKDESLGEGQLQGPAPRGDQYRVALTDGSASSGRSISLRKVFTVYQGSDRLLTVDKNMGTSTANNEQSRQTFHRGPVASPLDRGLTDRQVRAQTRAELVKGQHREIHGTSIHYGSLPASQERGSRWIPQDQGRSNSHMASSHTAPARLPADVGILASRSKDPRQQGTSSESEKTVGKDGMSIEKGDGASHRAQAAFQSAVGLVDSSQTQTQRLSIDKSGPSSVEGRPGQTVRLPCRVTPSDSVTVEWRRDGRPLSSSKHRQQADGTLLVGPLESEDAGWLLCVASNDRERDHRYIYLSVSQDARSASQNPSVRQASGSESVPPAQLPSSTGAQPPRPGSHRLSIDKSGPSSVEGRPGQTVRLPCRVTSSALVTVEWRRDGRPLTSPRYTQQSDGSLVISRLSTEDSGFYTCTASNGHQRDNRQLQLRVLDLKITTAPNNVRVVQGSSTQLPCVVSGNNVNVGWSRNGVPVRPDGRHVLVSVDGSLILNNVQPADEGAYTCNAYTGTYSVSATAEVKVNKSTEQALPSSSNTAECTDQPELANCDLIVYAKLCSSEYYSNFCCASCSRHSQPAGSRTEQG
ncbi:papilin isoform X2 [Amia ocellicauda]|uniref:papilin isoform X2 n=1 Tax=Amia ocellicauda TaxID=2972642 RepID=UPI003463B3D4